MRGEPGTAKANNVSLLRKLQSLHMIYFFSSLFFLLGILETEYFFFCNDENLNRKCAGTSEVSYFNGT